MRSAIVDKTLALFIKIAALYCSSSETMASYKQLTKEQANVALEEAKERGLPEGWILDLYDMTGRKKYVAADGSRHTDSVPRAVKIDREMKKQSREEHKKRKSEKKGGDMSRAAKRKPAVDARNGDNKEEEEMERRPFKRQRSSSTEREMQKQARAERKKRKSEKKGRDRSRAAKRKPAADARDGDNKEEEEMERRPFKKQRSSSTERETPSPKPYEEDDDEETEEMVSPNNSSADTEDDEEEEEEIENDSRKRSIRSRSSSIERQRRRKIPSEKIRTQLQEKIQTSRPSKNRKEYRNNRKRVRDLPKEEETEVLKRAHSKGLPNGWKVKFHQDWQRNVWISPDGTRMCDTVPRAMATHEKMENEDKDDEMFENTSDNDDDDNKEKQEEDDEEEVEEESGENAGGHKIEKRLTQKEIEKSLKKARAKGLEGDGWQVVWNNRYQRKNWISPNGRVYGNLSRAIQKQHDEKIRLAARLAKKAAKELKKTTVMEKLWKKRFRELKKYKKKHGDSVVPQHYSEVEGLGTWVKRQRYEYKRRQKGDHAKITDERIAALNSIGFCWKGKASASPDKQQQQQQPRPPEGSVFDNAPNEMYAGRHALFTDMHPPPPAPARHPINFVHTRTKRPNGALGSEEYFREVEQYLKTWYGLGPAG
jgi:hypothetical protein